jgi:hypothetical protein
MGSMAAGFISSTSRAMLSLVSSEDPVPACCISTYVARCGLGPRSCRHQLWYPLILRTRGRRPVKCVSASFSPLNPGLNRNLTFSLLACLRNFRVYVPRAGTCRRVCGLKHDPYDVLSVCITHRSLPSYLAEFSCMW